MAGLILKLKAHEQILVNGVVMQNGDRNARLIVKTPDARILRLRDAIHPDDAVTPVKRACYTAQLAVAGELDEDAAALDLARRLEALKEALGDLPEGAHLDEALQMLRKRNFYGTLRALRQLLPLEARLLAASTCAGGHPDARSDRSA